MQSIWAYVIIDEHLTFNEHIKIITSKANSFLQRNISSCTEMVKEACYKSMIRPILEYASTVWSLYMKKNILMIEAVQRRAARFVTNTYDQTSSVTAIWAGHLWSSVMAAAILKLCEA